LIAFNPNTGEVSWRQEEYSISDELWEAGRSTVWELSRSFGDRLVVLGDKVSRVYDVATGEVIGSYEIEYDKKMIEEAITFSTDEVAVLFGEDNTVGINVNTGAEIWRIEEHVIPKYGYVEFEHEGTSFALIGDKKSSKLLNLITGEVLWTTPEKGSSIMVHAEVLDNGLLHTIGFRSKLTIGTAVFAYGYDLMSGEVKYGPVPLVRSSMGSVFGQVHAIAIHLKDFGDEALYYTIASGSRGFTYDPNEEWGADWKDSNKMKGGEGFTRFNKRTGELIYSTRLTLFDNWTDHRKNWLSAPMSHPGAMIEEDKVIMPIFEDNMAYVFAEPGLVKVNLDNGKTVWSSPEYDHVSGVHVANGKVFGSIGWATWYFETDGDKAKGQVRDTKKQGFFVLDAATGEEIFVEETKDPMNLFLSYYDENANAYYLANGRYLRKIDLANPRMAWELDLKKDDFGEISDKGVAIITTGVETSISGAYISTTTNYSYSMAHGIFPMEDGGFFVLSEDAIGKVDASGSVVFQKEWKWRGNKINFAPMFTSQGLLYQYKKLFQMISLDTGDVIWKTKEGKAKDVETFVSQDKTKLFVVDKDEITCYRI
jgi:outer membrane protein assembly factor BamB